MSNKYLERGLGVLAGLILMVAATAPAYAMGAYGSGQVATGVIQSIDYQHHAIVINGVSYEVSPQATFRGIGGFSVLSVGMTVQATLGRKVGAKPVAAPAGSVPVTDANVITSITWIPPHA